MQTLSESTTEVADRLLRAVEAADAEGIASCCVPDVRIWHNYDDLAVGLDEVIPLLAMLKERVPDVRYDDVRRHPIESGYVQQHVVRGSAPSGPLDMPACLVVHVQDGLIARIEEYLDRQAIEVLRRPR
jgi:ketosteroid isomerase-like protein